MPRTCGPTLLLAVLLCSSGGLAGEPDNDTKSRDNLPVDTDGLKSGCFYAREVSNWDVLNRNYLIAYAPNKSRAYLVSFSPPSFELRSAATIGFEGGDRICGRPGDRLVIGRSRGMNYSIMDVWRLDSATVERLQENKKARDSGAVAPAVESPGAKIETDIKTGGNNTQERAAAPDPD